MPTVPIRSPSSLQWSQKYSRIKRHYSPTVAQYMKQIERAYADDDGSFVGLYTLLEYPLQRKARYYHRRLSWLQLSTDDILSALWQRVWTTCEQYRPGSTDYLLYEQIQRGTANVMKDLCRRQSTRQQQFERECLSFDDLTVEPFYTDMSLIGDMTLHQFIERLPIVEGHVLDGLQRGLSIVQLSVQLHVDRRTVTALRDSLRDRYHRYIRE